MEEKSKKIKILAIMDSPRVATGFGTVARGIFDNLAKTGKYEIEIFGVNDLGFEDPNPEKYPYKIMPAMLPGIQGDYYGRLRFINLVRGGDRMFLSPPWDIIFTLNDPFIFEEPVVTDSVGTMDVLKELQRLYVEKAKPEMWFKTVSYWPVDSYLKENWIEHAIALADHSIAYTNYGKDEIEKANNKLSIYHKINIGVLYHGTNVEDFHPISKEEKVAFRKIFFKKAKIDTTNTFIVGCVARNQMRKDIPRVMKIFKEFQKRRPDSMLYIHAREQDAWGSLGEYARYFNLELGKDWIFPGNFNEAQGYPIEALNKIYNIMDVQIQATKGEGWGLAITEAMAAGVLNMAPNITSIPELFGTEKNDIEDLNDLKTNTTIRGVPVKSGSTSSEWITDGPTDFERIRPLTNVDDAVRKLIWVYDNPKEAQEIATRGHDWIQQFSWKNIANLWDEFFQKVYNDLEEERKVANEKIKESADSAVPTNGSTDLPSQDEGAGGSSEGESGSEESETQSEEGK